MPANQSKLYIVCLTLALCVATSAAQVTPVTAGAQGPFSAPQVDVADHGYVVHEFYLDGTAKSYELAAGERTRDGRWQTRVAEASAPFRSRILVVRPEQAAAFNGTVIVHWQNVTAGFELGTVSGGEILNGYAWVGVSAQKIGVDGMGESPAGLKQWDGERYGSLNHPGDAYSYDIFTQAGQALRPDRKHANGVDPMGGLEVKHLVAAGASQSAHRLRTYINGVHPLEGVFDGFIPYIDFGMLTPFENRAGGPGGTREQAAIRDDLDAPVLVVNSETEAEAYFGVREPDSDRFRFWEVAGTSHVSVQEGSAMPGPRGANWLSYQPVYDSALRHMHTWLTTGKAPPVLPRIEVEPGMPPVVRRDERGNALGGIRLPELAVPTAVHSGMGPRQGGTRFAFLYGQAHDMPAEEITKLYPSRAAYLTAYESALAKVVASGAVLPEAAEALKARAGARYERLTAN